MIIQTACGLEDIVFGKAVSGRDKTLADVSNLVGFFINTVLVSVKIEKNFVDRNDDFFEIGGG